jgi:threonine/homoserine/homoserine lactone efflux protein
MASSFPTVVNEVATKHRNVFGKSFAYQPISNPYIWLFYLSFFPWFMSQGYV